MRVQPDEGILLRFSAKVPGLGLDVRAVTMNLSYGSSFSVDSPDAYETLILDAGPGRCLALSEVEAAWRISRRSSRPGSMAPSGAPQLCGGDLGPGGGRCAL